MQTYTMSEEIITIARLKHGAKKERKQNKKESKKKKKKEKKKRKKANKESMTNQDEILYIGVESFDIRETFSQQRLRLLQLSLQNI